MSAPVSPDRRRFIALLLASAASPTFAQQLLAAPSDRGIGGTGARFDDDADRGIGGTGVIGTIRRFGSIVVNDLRIAYPSDASVLIDGRPAAVGDLEIGQVVRVAASGPANGLSTRTIDVTHEVVGPIERIGGGQIVVLGQTVSTAFLKRKAFALGDRVAVSGLRRNDGTIVASLVEPAADVPNRVAGPVRLDPSGAIKVGGLALAGADPALIGRRAVVEGAMDGGRFAVSHSVSEAALLPASVSTLSIESYVERQGDRLVSGSGYLVSAANVGTFPAGRSSRAILSTSIGPDGGLILDTLRANGRTYRVEPRGGLNAHGPGSHLPGARRPMDFGPRHSDVPGIGGNQGPDIGPRFPGGIGGPGPGFGGPGGLGGGFGGPGGLGGGPPGGLGGGRR